MSDDVQERQLLSRLVPDPEMGDLLGFLATSYELDPEFFDSDWLPTIAGLKAHNDRSRRGRLELERALAGTKAVLLVDAQAYRERPRSLRVEVCPGLGEGRRKLHAKVSVLVYDRAVRVTLGSANLTHAAYRENREIVTVWTVRPEDTADGSAIRSLLNALPDAMRDWWGASRSIDQVLELANERLRAWPRSDDAADAVPVLSGRGTPLWEQVLDAWGPRKLASVHIASPFWSSETGPNRAVAKFADSLASRGLLLEDTTLELRCELTITPTHEHEPVLPAGLAALDLPPGLRGRARPVDARVLPDEVGGRKDHEGTRKLHAKVVVLSDGERALAYCGSANFTAYGWGFHASRRHAEAGVLVEGQTRALMALLPPLDPEGTTVVLGSLDRGVGPSDDDEVALPWPAFIRGLWLRRRGEGHEIHLDVDVVAAERAGWALWMPREDQGTVLVDHRAGATVPSAIPLSAEAVAELLVERRLLYREPGHAEPRSLPLNVDPDLRETLPMTTGGQDPREDELLSFYLGRIAYEDAFPDDSSDGSIEGDDDDPPVLRIGGVDTSGIKTYQMRLFVDALPGVREDLLRASRSPSSMRVALVGPVSPVALAREVALHRTRSWAAKGFQLVEILACVEEAARLDVRPEHRERWQDATDDARNTLERLLDGITQVDETFQSYRARVLSRATGNP
jgi:phosphatidylserine/phosphatidylglycerophosphate/cardiolipin synthase-like enzyme